MSPSSRAGADTVSVLAGGWSVAGLDLARLPGHVIAVNDSGVRSPRVDAIVSMDRLWTEYRWPGLVRLQRPTWLRNACLPNIAVAADGNRPAWLSIYMNDWQSSHLSGTKGVLNGTNSGLVALNLAYQLAPRRVVLFGFDMGRCPRTRRAYWHPDYPWRPGGGTSNGKYAEWARQFEPAARSFADRGIEVLNASPASRIPAFAKVDPNKLLT